MTHDLSLDDSPKPVREFEAEGLLSRPERVFQLTRFGYADHRLSRAHVAAILNQIAPYIMRRADSISQIEVIGFSSGPRHQYFHAQQRAINVKNALVEILRDQFAAPVAVLSKIELAPTHRPLPLDPSGVSNPEHRKVAIQIFSGGSEMESAARAQADAVATNPTPGSYYRIKRGDTLVGVAGRAYGVPAGQARLAYARFINGYPVNRKFYSRSSGDFDQIHFPNGIISFTPIFSCGQTAIDAPIGHGSCFPLIYIPKTSVLDRGRISVSRGEVAGSWSELQQELESARFVEGSAGRSACPAPKRRGVSDATAVPYRWTCKLTLIFDGGKTLWRGSGFLIAPDIVLTAGHNLFHISHDGKSQPPKTSFAERVEVEFGANSVGGDLRAASPKLEMEIKEGLNASVSEQWRRTNKSFLAIPPGANHSRRMVRTTKAENQFDFGILKLDQRIGEGTIRRRERLERFGHWGGAGSDSLMSAESIAAIKRAKKNDQFLSISGYPEQAGVATRSVVHSQCVHDILDDVNSLVLYATNSNVEDNGGSSGGPIYLREATPILTRTPSPLRVVGVHVTAGYGVILTEKVLIEIEHMKSRLR